jgi:aminoglycoside 6'-N-acetyltransferase
VADPAANTPRRAIHRSAVAAGLAVGCLLTWNLSNVGAVADPLAAAYSTSLAVIGLLTTALFLTHLAAQLPAGIWSDRFGPHRVLEKLGMRREAHFVENEWVKGEWQSELVYAILAGEWPDASAGTERDDGRY